jgi:hypothetical protein
MKLFRVIRQMFVLKVFLTDCPSWLRRYNLVDRRGQARNPTLRLGSSMLIMMRWGEDAQIARISSLRRRCQFILESLRPWLKRSMGT